MRVGVDRQILAVIAGIHKPRQAKLFVIAHALDCHGSLFGPAQGRQQQRSQNGNDGNDHQQLDQSETPANRPHPIVWFAKSWHHIFNIYPPTGSVLGPVGGY
jgi:hypothetical protein